MINENIIEKLSERLGNRADKANIVFLKEIGNIIKAIKNKKNVNYLDSYYRVINKVKKITEQNINDLFSILNAIAKDIKKDVKQYYEYRGIKYTPYDEDIQAQIAVERLFIPIMEEYKARMNEYNLGTAIKENRVVYNNINQTFNKVISDGNLYQDLSEEEYYYRMQETEKQLGRSGIKSIDRNTKRSIGITTLAVLTTMNSIRSTNNTMQERFGTEFGANGLEIVPHSHPAPDHAPYQGKQFTFEEFDDLQASLSRPIGEYNCYHDLRRIIKGVTKPLYSKKELKQIRVNNEKGFELDGKHYTLYEGTQLQRKIERAVKEQKNIQILAKASGDKELVRQSQSKITQLNNKYKEIVQKGNLESKKYRMTVSGYRRINVNKM